MSIERVREHFRTLGIENRILEFDVSSATVPLAAQAVGTEEARIAKSLSFLVDDRAIIIVVAGTARINNKRYKEFFHKKAKMLSPEQVTEMIGHKVGGVCPFAVNEGVEVYLDESLKAFPTVFPACGSSNSAIELTIPELEEYSGFKAWIDVCSANE